MIFLIINRPNFVYLLVDSGTLPYPQLNFYAALHFVHWCDGCQTNGRVRLSIRWSL